MPRSVAFRRKLPCCPACGDSFGMVGIGGYYYICTNEHCIVKEPNIPVCNVWWTRDFQPDNDPANNFSPYKEQYYD